MACPSAEADANTLKYVFPRMGGYSAPIRFWARWPEPMLDAHPCGVAVRRGGHQPPRRQAIPHGQYLDAPLL